MKHTDSSLDLAEEKAHFMKHTNSPLDLAEEKAFDEKFRPRGAMAFFVLLVLLGLIIWFGIYFLMLSRV